jgi:hypothetical protein
MEPNPVLRKLGFSDQDRVVIIHTDDIGMCHASLAAYEQMVEIGIISSGATMVPCSWFPATADFCRQHPQVDMGVHLTLNSEWDAYRWSPISTCDLASGLIDSDGYFHHWQPAVYENADPTAVQVEIQAQLERALAAGIDVTHIDTHMGTVAGRAKFIPGYAQLAFQHRLPLLILRQDVAGYQAMGMDEQTATFAAQFVHIAEEQEVPLLDHIASMNLDQPNERLEQAKRALGALPIGITHFILHPSIDTPELRSITPDWACRVADYRTFSDLELHRFIKNEGIQVIGYRALRDVMRSSA